MSIFRKKIKSAVDDGLDKAHRAMQSEEGEEKKSLLSSLPGPIFAKVARMGIAVVILIFFSVFTSKLLEDYRGLALLFIPAFFVVQIIMILITYKKGKYAEYEGKCLDVPRHLLPGASERARKVVFAVTNEDGSISTAQYRAVFRKDEFVPGLTYRFYVNKDDDAVLFAWELIGKEPDEEKEA